MFVGMCIRKDGCTCRFNERLTHLESMGSVVILGGNAGGVHLVSLDSGDLVATPKMEDHEGPVTGLSAHMALRHFISCSSDGMLKVWNSTYQCLNSSRLLPKCMSLYMQFVLSRV